MSLKLFSTVMPDFSFKTYQIQCWLELHPRPCWGSPQIPSWIWGKVKAKRMEGEAEEKRILGNREGRGREEGEKIREG